MKSHDVPSHEVLSAPVGLGQAEQAVGVEPQVSVLVFVAQIPLQSCVPDGQEPEQAMAASIQAPAHTCCPAGQLGTHFVPLHVTLPPVGALHSSQDEMPQLVTRLLLTQTPPQV